MAQLIEALLERGAVDGVEISTGDIGVVTPFRKQVQTRREVLPTPTRTRSPPAPFRYSGAEAA